jgi:hypothetical protein
MTLIEPADCIAKELYDKCVRDGGGEATTADMTVVDRYEVDRSEDTSSPVDVLVTGVTGFDFSDSDEHMAHRDSWNGVEQILTLFPAVGNYYSHAEIAERLSMQADGEPDVRDTRIAADTLRAECNKYINSATQAYLRNNDLPYSAYGQVIERLWAEVKKASSWPRGQELGTLDDLELLQRLRDETESLYRRLAGRE